MTALAPLSEGRSVVAPGWHGGNTSHLEDEQRGDRDGATGGRDGHGASRGQIIGARSPVLRLHGDQRQDDVGGVRLIVQNLLTGYL